MYCEISPFNKELHQILYGNKKGASRCIYPREALHCLRTINANDPRPKRAVVQTSMKLVLQTETYRKTACLRERSPCPRSLKFADFTWRTRAKLFYTLKITLIFSKKSTGIGFFCKFSHFPKKIISQPRFTCLTSQNIVYYYRRIYINFKRSCILI